MPLTRLQLKNRIKSTRGLTRDREDGLLDDTLIHEAIEESLLKVGMDAGLLQTRREFSLEIGVWEYAMPDNVHELRSVWYKDSNGTRFRLGSCDQEAFYTGRDPEDDRSIQPSYYSYPIYQSRVLQPMGLARPLHDYVRYSHVTTGHRRTVEDTAINFGRTLDGTKISPADIIRNKDTKAYGYVEVMDVITEKVSNGLTMPGTNSTTLVDGTVNFVALGVAEDDIICTPATGVVQTYAFVTEVALNSLTYEAIRGVDTAFGSGDTYKVGIAQKIRLTTDPPHRGLREGTSAVFNVGSTTATMNATTFTDTRCTGSSPSGAAIDEIAIASGGSHGKITAVESNYIDVEEWIGGTPVDGETITIQACDEYQVETRPQIEPVMRIGPTPSSSDDVAERSIEVMFIKQPFIPSHDWQMIDIPDKYRIALYKCCKWQAADLAGSLTVTQVDRHQVSYEVEIAKQLGDAQSQPIGEIQTVWGNRRGRRTKESRYTTRSGASYDVSNIS